MGVRIIASLTIREAGRRRIILAAFILGLAFLALYAIGLYFMLIDARTGMPRTIPAVARHQAINLLLMMGLYTVNWLLVLTAVLSSVDTLAGEIASGVMQAVATKPLRRWEIVAGKWLGYAAMITVFLLVMAGGVLFEIRLMAGHLPPGIPAALALMWLEAILLLGVTLRAGASLSTLAVGITVLGLHILAFLGGWIEEFGALAQSQTAVDIGVVASLIMPSEALWRRAASTLQGPIIGAFGRTPFSSSSVPSAAMVWYAAIYAVAAVGFAVRRFSRRDL